MFIVLSWLPLCVAIVLVCFFIVLSPGVALFPIVFAIVWLVLSWLARCVGLLVYGVAHCLGLVSFGDVCGVGLVFIVLAIVWLVLAGNGKQDNNENMVKQLTKQWKRS